MEPTQLPKTARPPPSLRFALNTSQQASPPCSASNLPATPELAPLPLDAPLPARTIVFHDFCPPSAETARPFRRFIAPAWSLSPTVRFFAPRRCSAPYRHLSRHLSRSVALYRRLVTAVLLSHRIRPLPRRRRASQFRTPRRRPNSPTKGPTSTRNTRRLRTRPRPTPFHPTRSRRTTQRSRPSHVVGRTARTAP